ncbi:alpha/beta fold hydrolase [Saccharopolyspora sp. NPDC000995]
MESAFPQAPRFLLGHSLGGQIALLHTARHPYRVHGVALVASDSVWFRKLPRGAQVPHAVRDTGGTAVSALLGYCPDERFGFGSRQATDLCATGPGRPAPAATGGKVRRPTTRRRRGRCANRC